MAILVHRQALPYIRRQPGWQTAIMVQHRRTVRGSVPATPHLRPCRCAL